MKETFNAVEVFKIAEQIERDGAAFYRKAAEMFTRPDICELFGELVEWELEHERTFADMKADFQRDNLSATVVDPEKCKAMAALSEFTIKSATPRGLAESMSLDDVLRIALQKERNSVTFYTGLKGFIAEPTAAAKIDDIIGQELQHIEMLTFKQ
jgi:rubrerythrin